MTFILTHINRNVVMFLLGASGFAHEVLLAGAERPFIISACCALMGLPFVLQAQDRKKDEKEE